MLRILKKNLVSWIVCAELIGIGMIGKMLQQAPGPSALEQNQYYLTSTLFDALMALGWFAFASLTLYITIKELRTRKQCPFCGNPVNRKTDNFCATCGQKL